MPTKCKKCLGPFDQPKSLYDLKVCREKYVNDVANNVVSWSFELIKNENIARYLNTAIEARGFPKFNYEKWITPRQGLIFFDSCERIIGRKTFCVSCAGNEAHQLVNEASTD